MDELDQDAYEKGYQAYWQDVGYDENPFPADSNEHQEWLDGWMAANLLVMEDD